jgi:hypothetical protein
VTYGGGIVTVANAIGVSGMATEVVMMTGVTVTTATTIPARTEAGVTEAVMSFCGGH